MSHSPRPVHLLLGGAAVAWAAAHLTAQPHAGPAVPRPADPPATYTAFPDIRVGWKEVERDGVKRPELDDGGRRAKILAGHPRPTPADATPLVKVRIAQANELVAYVVRTRARMDIGAFQPPEYLEYLKLLAELAKLAAELEPTAAGKITAHEAGVGAFKEAELFTGRQVQAGTAPPHQLNVARFHRLKAEEELLLLKERLGEKK